MRHVFVLFLLAGCAKPIWTVPSVVPTGAAVDLAEPGPVTVETVVSARWEVAADGLIDLDDPKAADIPKDKRPIEMLVHVLTHPDHGVFVIDTGISAARAAGDRDVARGLVRSFLSGIDPVESLASILARQEAPLAGVLITHTHIDHLLGLRDVPPRIPLYAGPGEGGAHKFTDHLVHPSIRRAFDGRPISEWTFDRDGVALGPIPQAIDIVGDGSIWALYTPGHTPGSTAYLARTPDGPVLFVGDNSHTRFGWDNDVTPGTFTLDHEGNARSLAQLRALAGEYPTMRVVVGHEL